jgi:PhnO protein
MDSLAFREAAVDDCRAVYDMICDMEAKALPYAAFEAIYLELSENSSHDFILGCLDGTVVAVIHLRYENQLHHAGRIAEIMEFVVRDGYRNKGIGKVLLAYAGQLAADRGCLQIEVACNQLRKDTHRFYLREGMKNYHYKFSMRLSGPDIGENVLGR